MAILNPMNNKGPQHRIGHQRAMPAQWAIGASIVGSLVCLFLAATSPLAIASGSSQNKSQKEDIQMPQSPTKAKSVPGQYLISFEAQITEQQRMALFAKVDVKLLEKVGSSPLFLISIEGSEKEVSDKIVSLQKTPGVRYVEANLVMETFKTE